jgi:hypothetical protein
MVSGIPSSVVDTLYQVGPWVAHLPSGFQPAVGLLKIRRVAVAEPIGEHDLEEETAVPLRLDLAEYNSNITLALNTFPDLNEVTGFH